MTMSCFNRSGHMVCFANSVEWDMKCGHGMYYYGFFSAGINISVMPVRCLSTK